ncbi:MAG: type VI secretion system baseplate subunit TssG [Pseudomonadota bacterium]
MAGENRNASDSLALLAALREAPWAHDFFAAARRLQAARPEAPGFGRSGKPADDPVRFTHHPSLAFAPRTISALTPPPADCAAHRLELFVNGLYGPNGPLPATDTERTADRMKQARDDAAARFADIFHHRFYSLLFRAWADGRPELALDRRDRDPFVRYLAALGGLEHARKATSLGDAIVPFAVQFAGGPARAETLERIGARLLGVRVEARPFVGVWMRPPERDLARLGAVRLDRAAPPVLGERVFTRDQAFEIALGPMGGEDARRLAPAGADAGRLRDVVGLSAGLSFGWRARLRRERTGVAPARLDGGSPLGFDCWLGPVAKAGPPLDDLVFSAERYQTPTSPAQ